ncbi:MAG: hypothetical protein HOP11_13750 [Saprospiraceae bacterium]|nr:hypothetical protein [Saprospiraceae bacterium]
MKKNFVFFILFFLNYYSGKGQTPGNNFGYKAIPYPGGIPVLTILWQFSDTEKFPADYESRYAQLVFGENNNFIVAPSLGGKFGFYNQISNGHLNFLNAGIIGPIIVKDIPGTTYDESKVTDFGLSYAEHFRLASLEAEAAGFDFRIFDKNGNGIINADELVVNIIHSERYAHEYNTTTDFRWVPPSGISDSIPYYNESGYTFSKLLGYVYQASQPAPKGTVPLNFWWSPLTGDNYSTLDIRPAIYDSVGIHGFVFENSLNKPPNTVGIFTWYNSERKDYLLNSIHNIDTGAAALKAMGYSFVRSEGFILDPSLPKPNNTVALYFWKGNGSIGGAQNVGINFNSASGLQIQSRSVSVAQDCIHNLSVLGHEMIHHGGGIDIYGARGAKNFRYSLMSSLQSGVRLSHPDPMNKIMAGWIEPIVNTIGTKDTFEILGTETSQNSKGKAYIFYDSLKGNKEFFILEYRYRNSLRNDTTLVPFYNNWDLEIDNRWFKTSSSGVVLFDTKSQTQRNEKTEGFIFKNSNPPPNGTIPLYSWYSCKNIDGITTTDPEWSGKPGDVKAPDYKFKEILGFVYDPTLPQPPNTIPLYSWFSSKRNDHFISADKNWTGTPGLYSTIIPDYVCIRLEGYIVAGSFFNYDGSAFNNLNGIPDIGLAIWYVHIGENGFPLVLPARDPDGNPMPGEVDAAVYIYPVNRRYGFSQNLFKKNNGPITVSWPDGSVSGLVIEILTTNLTLPVLKFRTK